MKRRAFLHSATALSLAAWPESGRSAEPEAPLEVLPGTLPLVLSTPHGGRLRPADLPDRTTGVLSSDRNTAELTKALTKAVTTVFGAEPHRILSCLHRIKLDPNREIDEAAQGHPVTGEIWQRYHDHIAGACRTAVRTHGGAVLLDLHGHAHALRRVELGYLLSAEALALSDARLAQSAQVRKCSLRRLPGADGAGLVEALRGPASLGAFLSREGYSAVPSPDLPAPGDHPYFQGGYTITHHVAADYGGPVLGIQIETPFPSVRGTPEEREHFAMVLARALKSWMEQHLLNTSDPKIRLPS